MTVPLCPKLPATCPALSALLELLLLLLLPTPSFSPLSFHLSHKTPPQHPTLFSSQCFISFHTPKFHLRVFFLFQQHSPQKNPYAGQTLRSLFPGIGKYTFRVIGSSLNIFSARPRGLDVCARLLFGSGGWARGGTSLTQCSILVSIF